MSYYTDFKELLFAYDRGSKPIHHPQDMWQADRVKFAIFCACPIIFDTAAVDNYYKSLDVKHRHLLAECLFAFYGSKHLLNFVEYREVQFILKRLFYQDYYYASIHKIAPSALAKNILKSKQAIKLMAESFGFEELDFSQGLQEFVRNHACDDFEKEKPQITSAQVWSTHIKFFEPYKPKELKLSMLDFMSFTRLTTQVDIFYNVQQSYTKEDSNHYVLKMQANSKLVLLRFLLEYTTLDDFISLVNTTVTKFANQTPLEKFRQQFLVE